MRITMARLVDLSQEIYNKSLVHPIHPQPMVVPYLTHESSAKDLLGGASFQTKLCVFSDHVGTHADAFCHFDPDPGALTMERMDLNLFYGEAICIDVSFVPELEYITVDHLKKAIQDSGQKLNKGDILLLYTGMADKYFGKEEYLTRQAGLNEESSVWLFEQGVKLLGIDAVSTDMPADQSYPNHRMSAKYKVTHIENLANLKEVIGKRFVFIGLPLKIRGGSGAPLRAAALVD